MESIAAGVRVFYTIKLNSKYIKESFARCETFGSTGVIQEIDNYLKFWFLSSVKSSADYQRLRKLLRQTPTVYIKQ